MKSVIISNGERVTKDITLCLQVRYPDAEVVNITRGLTGIEFIEKESPDLVLVDCSLPDMTPVDIITTIREFSDVALITLCSIQTELERAELLEKGADEYVVIPFSPIELLAIVGALLRRTLRLGFKAQKTVSIGSLTIDFNSREVLSSGKRVHLTPIEYNLLSELVRNQGNVLPNTLLLEKIWGADYGDGQAFVKKYVHRLRTKLEVDSDCPRLIVNERGVGYKFVKLVE
jgi:two-component system, OmpR family, KDP operon response regulator KdpE